MKRIQLKLNKRIFAIDVADDTKTDDYDVIHNALSEQLKRNNEKESVIFYEELEMVCSECGVSLNDEDEQEDGMCVQCSNQ